MHIFDGTQFARQWEQQIHTQVAGFETQPCIAAVYFSEDSGSVLYTTKKKDAAQRVGIEYQQHTFSYGDELASIVEAVTNLNSDTIVTGIIIQKPTRRSWLEWHQQQGKVVQKADFNNWWQSLIESITPSKDVDGLHPSTLAAVEQGTWQEQGKVMPATARAVLAIVTAANDQLNREGESTSSVWDKKFAVLGKSDILGQPLFFELQNRGCQVEMMGSTELAQRVEEGKFLHDCGVIISATGRFGLITPQMIKPNSVLIDVGEPKADLQFAELAEMASFITPVPGGVGPVTIAALLQNCCDLITSQTSV